MGAVRFTNPGSGSYTLPSSRITRIWVSCVGAGGGSLGGLDGSFFSYQLFIGGGGGGWGHSSLNAPTDLDFNYTVGRGGDGSSDETNGPENGGNSSCLGVIGYGGLGAKISNVTLTGGTFSGYYRCPGGEFVGEDGANGQAGVGVDNGNYRVRGGGAGGTTSTECPGGDSLGPYKSNVDIIGVQNPNRDIDNVVSTFTTCSGGYFIGAEQADNANRVIASGGGNGNDGTGTTVTGELGSISPINETFRNEENRLIGIKATVVGGNGIYGGGGSPSTGGNFSDTGDSVSISQQTVSSYTQGRGGHGVVYISWIDLTVSKTTLRSNEPITVSWSSPVDSGSESVSYTNNGTSNITQTYTRTDSRGAQSTIAFTIRPAARINTFTANPFSQTSGLDGVPNYDTILSWTTTGATSASINQNIGSVEPDDSITVTNLPQSVAGVTSPATRTYTLTVSDGFNTDTETVTVSVYNDNTPNNFTISNRSDLQPDTFYVINLGSITGIDMVTNVIGGPGVTVSKNNLDNYVGSITIVNGDSVQLRFRSDPFNTDPTGLPTAPKTLSVTIGTLTRTFTVSTRAPDVNETFNLPDETDRVPFPDIDTINEPSLPYINADTLSIDDIELQDPNGVEIKTDNPNTQVRINGGPWQDVRSI